MTRVALLAPSLRDRPARLLTHLLARESSLTIEALIVKTSPIRRLLSERKVRRKRKTGNQPEAMLLEEPSSIEHLGPLSLNLKQEHLSGVYLDDLAEIHKLPLFYVPSLQSNEVLKILEDRPIHLLLYQGSETLDHALLDIPLYGLLRWHKSLLPQYCGSDSVEWSLLEGSSNEMEVGICAYFMDTHPCGGPVLLQQKIPFMSGENLVELHDRLETAGVYLFLEVLRGLRNGNLRPRPQEPRSSRTYYCMHPRLLRIAEQRLCQIQSVED